MAQKKKTSINAPRKKFSFLLSKQQKILLGSFLFLLGLALLFSFVSYFFTWQADQSEIGNLAERELQTKNWLNKFGANVAHFFIYDGFGISALIFGFLITLTGIYYFFDYAKKQLLKFWFWGGLLMLWISVFFGFFGEKTTLLSGIIGYETNDLMQDYLGLIGALLVMLFVLIVYLVVRLKLTPEIAIEAFKSSKKQIASEFISDEQKKSVPETISHIEEEVEEKVEEEKDIPTPHIEEKFTPQPIIEKLILKSDVEGDVEMEVERAPDEEEIENKSAKLVKDFGEF